jgi:FlaG/FlaF family flagellin (archaellin)
VDKKTLLAAFVGAIVTGFAGVVLAWVFGVFSAGSDALSEAQIKKVLQETQTTVINGETKSYGEALSIISTNQAVMKATLEALTEE